MKRGAVRKNNSKLVTVWFPEDSIPVMDAAVLSLDTDRAKFIRQAVREKIAKEAGKVANIA
jgi:hypothetical protein